MSSASVSAVAPGRMRTERSPTGMTSFEELIAWRRVFEPKMLSTIQPVCVVPVMV